MFRNSFDSMPDRMKQATIKLVKAGIKSRGAERFLDIGAVHTEVAIDDDDEEFEALVELIGEQEYSVLRLVGEEVPENTPGTHMAGYFNKSRASSEHEDEMLEDEEEEEEEPELPAAPAPTPAPAPAPTSSEEQNNDAANMETQ